MMYTFEKEHLNSLALWLDSEDKECSAAIVRNAIAELERLEAIVAKNISCKEACSIVAAACAISGVDLDVCMGMREAIRNEYALAARTESEANNKTERR